MTQCSWARCCNSRLKEQKVPRYRRREGCTLTNVSWPLPETPAQNPNTTSLKEEGELFNLKVEEFPHNSRLTAPLSDYRCMMDSMVSERSKFLTCNSKFVQKFAMPSIVLNDSMSSPYGIGQVEYSLINPSLRKCEITEHPTTTFFQKLFMHCEMSWGPETATESQKACTYNLQQKR